MVSDQAGVIMSAHHDRGPFSRPGDDIPHGRAVPIEFICLDLPACFLKLLDNPISGAPPGLRTCGSGAKITLRLGQSQSGVSLENKFGLGGRCGFGPGQRPVSHPGEIRQRQHEDQQRSDLDEIDGLSFHW